MSGRLEGKVALISGAARGQGRSHAIRLAQEGASIIAFDICKQIPTVPYPMAVPADLEVTAKEVQAVGGRILTFEADARDQAAVDEVVRAGVAEFGRLDIAAVNHGIVHYSENGWTSLDDDAWEDTISVNLSSVWRTTKAAIPAMLEAGNGGSIIITSSAAGLKGWPRLAHYSASKHGVVGLMRTLAIELAEHSIRVNTVHPSNIDTPMADGLRALAEANKGVELSPTRVQNHLLPVDLLDAVDISNAVLWLASDEARYVTGTTIPVDAGFTQR